jgi:hypothetical protein
VADHRLDAGAPPDLAADGWRDAAPLAGEEDAALVGFARLAVFGVVAAVAAIDIGALDGDAGDALGLGDLVGQRVAVEGVARQAARAEHDLSTGRWAIGGRQRDLHAEFEAGAGLALARVPSRVSAKRGWCPAMHSTSGACSA